MLFQASSPHPDIDAFLSSRAATFEYACAAMERARKTMTSQRKASANAHVYSIGDQVKISTRVLKP
jgi:hypothetical protein